MRLCLRITMMHLDPLPNPYYLAKKIRESFVYIDQNRCVTMNSMPAKLINFWRVKNLDLIQGGQLLPPDEDRPTHYSVTVSHIIFSYIYTRYYRDYDFADPDNFSRMYVSFQKLLLLASSLPEKRRIWYLSRVRPFDLKKLDHNIDWLTYLKK